MIDNSRVIYGVRPEPGSWSSYRVIGIYDATDLTDLTIPFECEELWQVYPILLLNTENNEIPLCSYGSALDWTGAMMTGTTTTSTATTTEGGGVLVATSTQASFEVIGLFFGILIAVWYRKRSVN